MLQDTINTDLVTAMKAKDQDTTLVLRTVMSEIKNKKIELQKDLEDADVVAVLKKMIKQRKDSIESYTAGGRDDLAAVEQQQIEVLKKYLPEEMSIEAVEEIVAEVISQTGASGMQDMGKVMGAAMQKVSGNADGNVVRAAVEKKLKNA